MSSRSMHVSGGTVEVHELGQGSPVLYLHGDLGNLAPNPFLEELAKDHAVKAPCLPGFAGSPDLTPTSLLDTLVAVGELCDVLGAAGCPVVASTIGAMLALELSAVRPDAFSRLVLLAPMGLWVDSDPTSDPWARPTSEQPAMFLADPARAASFFQAPPGLSPEDLMTAELRRYRTRKRAASLVWPIGDHGLAGRLHRISAPIHIIWGSMDQIAPPSYATRFKELAPTVESVDVVLGAGHLVEWDAPLEVAAHVRRCLTGSMPPSAVAHNHSDGGSARQVGDL